MTAVASPTGQLVGPIEIAVHAQGEPGENTAGAQGLWAFAFSGDKVPDVSLARFSSNHPASGLLVVRSEQWQGAVVGKMAAFREPASFSALRRQSQSRGDVGGPIGQLTSRSLTADITQAATVDHGVKPLPTHPLLLGGLFVAAVIVIVGTPTAVAALGASALLEWGVAGVLAAVSVAFLAIVQEDVRAEVVLKLFRVPNDPLPLYTVVDFSRMYRFADIFFRIRTTTMDAKFGGIQSRVPLVWMADDGAPPLPWMRGVRKATGVFEAIDSLNRHISFWAGGRHRKEA